MTGYGYTVTYLQSGGGWQGMGTQSHDVTHPAPSCLVSSIVSSRLQLHTGGGGQVGGSVGRAIHVQDTTQPVLK